MNQGRIEQVGAPSELYEHPATEFVMSFVGKVNRLGDAFIRPHEVLLRGADEIGCVPATVERVLGFGFEIRIELRLVSGQRVWAQLAAPEAKQLALTPGQRVGVDLSRRRRPGWQTADQFTVESDATKGSRADERADLVAGPHSAWVGHSMGR
jgi:sulfate transport system ATP-binding protein